MGLDPTTDKVTSTEPWKEKEMDNTDRYAAATVALLIYGLMNLVAWIGAFG